ncbi:MAG: RNA methyltransferase [Bryobacteraceae bacterium]|nr:RNA methyltransferase [Bryobacteraceae bacterium]
MLPRRTFSSAETRLTSSKNPLLREIRRAVERGSLTSDGLCVAEGFHLLEEAQRSPCAIELVVFADSVADRIATESFQNTIRVPDEVLASIAGTENTQGVIALVRIAEHGTAQMFFGNALVLVLDGIQDPGNAGTLIRTAEAFGVTGIMMSRGSVSVWNPKVVRASSGSVFRMPLWHSPDPSDIPMERVQKIVAIPGNGAVPASVDFTRATVIVVGSEARGVSDAWCEGATYVTIPTRNVESLNAAIAGSIVLYEALRQRVA